MGLIDAVSPHTRIMCDTAPIIYFVEEHAEYGKIADDFFNYATTGSIVHLFSSVITLTEVLVQPLRSSRMDIVEKYREFLINSGNFMLYSIDPVIAEKAAELRSRYSIKTPDAIQLAVGIENSATAFITNDEGLKSVKEIEVLVLSHYK